MSGSSFSMWDLFRGEVESQMRLFTDSLLAIEGGAEKQAHLASSMRAAHSIKGAAKIVQLDVAVRLAHVMEDCLVAADDGEIRLRFALGQRDGALHAQVPPQWQEANPFLQGFLNRGGMSRGASHLFHQVSVEQFDVVVRGENAVFDQPVIIVHAEAYRHRDS